MIRNIKQLPVTERSFPFSEAAEKCGLSRQGYEEKEYLFSGTANVYRSAGRDEVEVEYPDVPYTDRMVVRRPRDPKDFSGKVIIEITNATGHWDIERMWVISRRYFIRHGIIYIGLTSKPDVFDSLKRFDPARYGELCWPNPRPEEKWKMADCGAMGMPGFVHEDQECGLFWDILTDVAGLVRQKDSMNPLADYDVKSVALTGWSQSAGYLTRYVNSFAYRKENMGHGPVFDGYFNAGPVYLGGIPVNQEEYGMVSDSWHSFVHHVEQPFVIVQTESEITAFDAHLVPRYDSDMPGKLCRIYEIPGATHDTRQSLIDYYENDKSVMTAGVKPEYEGMHDYPNDYPYDYPMNAAYDHFFRWIESGCAPVKLPRIELDAGQQTVKDAFGNARGGMRTAFMDLPTCRYVPFSREKDGRNNFLFGHIELFTPEFLKELYGSLDRYRSLVMENTAINVEKGYILSEEAQLFIEDAVETAKKRGLV